MPKSFIWVLVVLLLLLVLFIRSNHQWFTFIEGMTNTDTNTDTTTPTGSPPITGTDPGVLARIAENAGNIKVLESRLNALSGIDSRVTTNTTNIKDLQNKIAALSVSQTQVLAGSI